MDSSLKDLEADTEWIRSCTLCIEDVSDNLVQATRNLDTIRETAIATTKVAERWLSLWEETEAKIPKENVPHTSVAPVPCQTEDMDLKSLPRTQPKSILKASNRNIGTARKRTTRKPIFSNRKRY
mmetsp:Transcript_5463/g.6356  ORF Transcript_5463/g.6356 Transcript_5463/m.6356 type:complete len:125 (-) Transcript_5463:58-432(-)